MFVQGLGVMGLAMVAMVTTAVGTVVLVIPIVGEGCTVVGEECTVVEGSEWAMVACMARRAHNSYGRLRYGTAHNSNALCI